MTDPATIHRAAVLAGQFHRLALAHLDRPMPARFDVAVDQLLAALLAIGEPRTTDQA